MRLLIGSNSPIMSSCNTVMSPCGASCHLCSRNHNFPIQAHGVFPISGSLSAAHTKQDPFHTYLGQEVSSISEILNEGGFHLTCHCSPLCAQGNPPSHHVNPAGTER